MNERTAEELVNAAGENGSRNLELIDTRGNVRKRRTAVERAQESLEKAKAKQRTKLLKLAYAKLVELKDLVNAAGGLSVKLAQGCDLGKADVNEVLVDIRAALYEEVTP